MGFVYIDPNRIRTLLETPSGFALFDVDEDALKEANDIWVYFRDVATAKNVMFALGFVKFDDKNSPWDGQTRPSKELIQLIQKYCKGIKPLIVQSADHQVIIQEKLKVKCSYDRSVVDELVWGIKNVLHGFVLEEKGNITREYRLPVSKGLQQCLQDHLINVLPEMLDADFISEIGLLHYLDITLKQVPKILRESFDEHVCGLGVHIENNLMYARVLARILVPELAPEYDFLKMFSPDIAQKIQEADDYATQYRHKRLTMHDRQTIMGALGTLLSVPEQRDDIMIHVKLMEAKLRRTQMINDAYRQPIREPMNFQRSTFRRTLLETPSGFAIFDVHEDVFKWPLRIWSRFTDDMNAREVVLALGFVNVHDKSIARNRYDGPGQELSSLIQKLCAHVGTLQHEPKLIVQDDALKSVIEEKLKVKCCTKFSNDDDSLGDLIWGLKNVLHEFIPQEEINLTKEYYLPMSKGLQSALVLYSISVSQEQMDRKYVNVLGYLVHLDWTLSFLPMIFRKSFDRHVCQIGKIIKDDLLYAKVVEQILVPESMYQFDSCELSNLADKVAVVAEKVEASGKFISMYDEVVIMAVYDYLSFIREKRDCYMQFLKYGGSEEELPRIDRECVYSLNYWLMSVTKASLSDKLIVDGLESLAHKMRDEDEGVTEVSWTGEKAHQEAEKTIAKINFSEDKSVHGDNFGLSSQDSFQKVSNVEGDSQTPNNVKPQQQLDYISETADYKEISKGAGNTDQQHYPITEGDIQATSSAIRPAVGAKVVSVYVAANVSSSVTMDDDIQKDVTSTECSIVYVEVKKQNEATTEGPSSGENNTLTGTHYTENKEQNADTTRGPAPDETELAQNVEVAIKGCVIDATSNGISTDNVGNRTSEKTTMYLTSRKWSLVTATNSIQGRNGEETSADPTSHKTPENVIEQKNEGPFVDPTPNAGTQCSIGDALDKKQSPATTEDHSSGENGLLKGTDNKEQNVDITTGPASDENTNVIVEGRMKDTTSEITIESTEEAKRANQNERTPVHSRDNVDDRACEQITTDPTLHMLTVDISSNSERKDEEINSDSTSQKTNTVHNTDNVVVEQKNEEHKEQNADSFSLVAATNSIQGGNDEKTSTGPTSHKTNAAHITDSVDEQKNEGPFVDPTIGDALDKKQSKATTEDHRSGENGMLKGTDDTDNKEQNAYTLTGPASDGNTYVIVEGRMKDTTSEEITKESTEEAKETDQNETTTMHSRDNIDDRACEQIPTDPTLDKLTNSTNSERKDEEISEDSTSQKTNTVHITDNVVGQKKQSEANTEDPRSGGKNTLPGTVHTENKEQNADASKALSQNTDTFEECMEGRTTGAKGTEQNEENAGKASSQNTDIFEEHMDDTDNKEQNAYTLTGPASDGNTYTKESTEEAKGTDQNEGTTVHSRDNVDDRACERIPTDPTLDKLTNSTNSERKDEEISEDSTSQKTNTVHATDNVVGQKKQSEANTEDPRSGGKNTLLGTVHTENKEQNADASKALSQNADIFEEHTGTEQNEEKNADSGRIRSTLLELLKSENMEFTLNKDDEKTDSTSEIYNSENLGSMKNDKTTDTNKEKKARIKNWLRLFRSRSSKDNDLRSLKDTMSPVKQGSRSGSMWRFRSKKKTAG